MKIILNSDVVNLGEEGDICEVATGYARNFLIPQNLAVPYSKQSLVNLETRKEAINQRKDEKRREALGLKDRLETESLEFKMSAGDSGKLFGSVGSAMIAEELEKRGYTLERKRIEVPDNHIRSTGDHTVRIKLYGQEEANVKVVVAKEEE